MLADSQTENVCVCDTQENGRWVQKEEVGNMEEEQRSRRQSETAFEGTAAAVAAVAGRTAEERQLLETGRDTDKNTSTRVPHKRTLSHCVPQTAQHTQQQQWLHKRTHFPLSLSLTRVLSFRFQLLSLLMNLQASASSLSRLPFYPFPSH